MGILSEFCPSENLIHRPGIRENYAFCRNYAFVLSTLVQYTEHSRELSYGFCLIRTPGIRPVLGLSQMKK